MVPVFSEIDTPDIFRFFAAASRFLAESTCRRIVSLYEVMKYAVDATKVQCFAFGIYDMNKRRYLFRVQQNDFLARIAPHSLSHAGPLNQQVVILSAFP